MNKGSKFTFASLSSKDNLNNKNNNSFDKMYNNPLTPIGSNSTQENSPRNSPDMPRHQHVWAGLHAADTLRHARIDFFTYSDDHGSRQSGLCPSRERSVPSRRGHMWPTYYVGLSIISSGFETAAGVRGLYNQKRTVTWWNKISRIKPWHFFPSSARTPDEHTHFGVVEPGVAKQRWSQPPLFPWHGLEPWCTNKCEIEMFKQNRKALRKTTMNWQ